MIRVCPVLDNFKVCDIFSVNQCIRRTSKVRAGELLVTLQITASHDLITPTLDRKMKNNIARKSGLKQVAGDVYKRRSNWQKACDFIQASRAVSVVGKAHFESKQYAQAAILRKNHQAEQRTQLLDRDLTDEEYDAQVWNSNGVQNRLTREDFVRYSQNHYTAKAGATPRNVRAGKISHVGHALHGICEMNAAPTGMTYNILRNTTLGSVDEKSTKNKALMFGLLGFIGVGTTELLGARIRKAADSATFMGQGLSSVLIAFPIFSSFMGLIGTLTGVASQMVVEKQAVSPEQQSGLSSDLSKNLQKLLSQLKSIKDKPELIQVMGKAMQGRNHIVNKIKSDSCDAQGVPDILNDVLAVVDSTKSDIENMRAMKQALGSYLQVEKPEGRQATMWARYQYAKAVTTKESHYVALVSTVDHMEVAYPHAAALKDARRWTEEKGAPRVHDALLNNLAKPAALIDRVANTNISTTLKKWGSQKYRDEQAAKLTDPRRASKNRFKGEYMAKNSHQYRPLTRSLIRVAEGMRLFNMNVVLASNANLSRIFNNVALQTQRTVGTGPSSRVMGNSVGRFFGGALLAIIFGTVIPIAADATGHPSTVSTNGKLPVDFSMTNIGILMFLLSTPTLAVQGLAQLAARIEGWEGNINKTVKKGTPTIKF